MVSYSLWALSNGKKVSAEELESQILQIAGAEEVVAYGEGAASPFQRVRFRETLFEKATTRKIKRKNRNEAGVC